MRVQPRLHATYTIQTYDVSGGSGAGGYRANNGFQADAVSFG